MPMTPLDTIRDGDKPRRGQARLLGSGWWVMIKLLAFEFTSERPIVSAIRSAHREDILGTERGQGSLRSLGGKANFAKI